VLVTGREENFKMLITIALQFLMGATEQASLLPNSGYGHRSGRELQVGAFAFYT
jgi:hypothetical protein